MGTIVHKQRGVVIIVALFLVALVATLSIAMLSRLDRDVYRTRLINTQLQAELYAQASVNWAMDQLRQDWIAQKPNKVIDPTPIESPKDEVRGYQIQSTILDAQTQFNINNLVTPESQLDFIRLLRVIDPQMSLEAATALVRAIVNWITPMSEGSVKNEYSEYYAHLPQPYRAAHRAMTDISELKLVKGITNALYLKLKPYLCALPTTTPLNIQGAKAPLLASLSPTMTKESAQVLMDKRKEKPFTDTKTFMNLDIVKNHEIAANKITTTSTYFVVVTDVNIGDQALSLKTVIERIAQDGKVMLRIVSQSK